MWLCGGGVEMERGPQMAVIINVVTWEFSDLMIYEASNLFNLLLVCVFFFFCAKISYLCVFC